MEIRCVFCFQHFVGNEEDGVVIIKGYAACDAHMWLIVSDELSDMTDRLEEYNLENGKTEMGQERKDEL
jgi:hypothetical protein